MVIVNDVRQMIGWMAIRLDENWIFKAFLFVRRPCSFLISAQANDSVNEIVVRGWDIRKLQSNHMRFPFGSTFFRLFSQDAIASSIVVTG